MYLEAVTTCAGYADYLAETIPFVRPHVDRWLIVTAPQDEETQCLCHARGLECFVTDDFYRNGTSFDKAKAIDHALMLLTHRDWLLHVDADIVLPGTFRESLEDAHLEETHLYGADRFMIRGWERWQRLKHSGFFDRHARSAHHNVCFPEGFPVGARWADVHQGYVPLGAFQLWHRHADHWRGIRTKRYAPHGHNDAARTDIQFGLQWTRRHRTLLPEVICGHLESEKGSVGANWSGRVTKRFGPPAHECPRPPAS